MGSEARPKIQSLGNSLTSISSLTTLPPSPIAQRNLSAHVGAVSGNKPTDIHVDPLGRFLQAGHHEAEEPVSTTGSVPSPKPRFAHLHASAPVRPRLPHPKSSPSYTRRRLPSPLNPASHHLRPTPPPPFKPIEGSVPNPKPNRLFTSFCYHSASPPTTTSPVLPRDQESDRCPPRLRNGQKGSAPRKISPSGNSAQFASVASTSRPAPQADEVAVSVEGIPEGTGTTAPNSFSTFVASIESLR